MTSLSEGTSSQDAHGGSRLKLLYDQYQPIMAPSITLLPTEVLLEIFQYCTRRPEYHGPHWLAFSQTCTYWRRITLEDPSLWTYPDFRKLALAQAMIQRARSMPMLVSVTNPTYMITKALAGHHNIERFSFSSINIGWSYDMVINTYLSGTFSALKDLELSCTSACAVDFELDAPRICSVVLLNWVPRWGASFLENLSVLSVTVTAPWTTQSLRYARLTDVLERNPRLQRLTLADLMSKAILEPPLLQGPPVELAFLEEIHIKDEIEYVNRLLHCISAPRLDRIDVTVILPSDDAREDLVALCTVLQYRISTAKWIALDHMMCLFDENVRVTLSGRDDEAKPKLLSMEICSDLDVREVRTFSQALVSTFPLQHLTDLDVCIWDTTAKPLIHFWVALSRLPALRDIEFEGPGRRAFEGLLNALTSNAGWLSDESHDQLYEPFPALQTLVLRCLKMYRKIADRSSLFWQMVAFLDRRRCQGLLTPDVTLDQCDFATPLVKLLDLTTRGVTIVKPRIILPNIQPVAIDRV